MAHSVQRLQPTRSGSVSNREGLWDAGGGDPHNLEDVLDQLRALGREAERVSIADIQAKVGKRSFGPLLLVLGLIYLTPIGGIPGVPTIFGVSVLLISGQLLVGHRHFWLPGFIARRSIKASRLSYATDRIRPVARWIDRLLRPRLILMTNGTASHIIAGCCILLAGPMPLMEVLPLVGAVPAFAVTMFGLALLARDGVFALLGFAATAVTFGLIAIVVPPAIAALT